MIPIVTPEEMGDIDAAAPEPVEVLIERAGRAVARAALEQLGGAYGRVVVVLAGGGNNGADGRAAAGHLARRGVKVHTFDAHSLPPELPRADLVIDAMYGTGFRPDPERCWPRPETGDATVLAVDVPSGVDALTGDAPDQVLEAQRTVTFQALKPGLLFGRGAQLGGRVDVCDIGLDVSGASAHVVERRDAATWWPRRQVDAHKWKGAVRVIAGSPGMAGAAQLCAAAAARAGAGLVSLSSPGTDPDARSEIIQRSIPSGDFAGDVLDDLDRFGALVVGPGIGREEDTTVAVRKLIADAPVPVVIDGDAIFACAWSADGAAPLLRDRTRPTVLTPHDGEYALLAGEPPGLDRFAAARTLAHDLDCTVVLKGPTTVVADRTGAVLVVDHGDERLATAGSGDVLAGMIGAVLAGGSSPLEGAAAAVWLHAETALLGPRLGLVAGDLVDLLPDALDRTCSGGGS